MKTPYKFVLLTLLIAFSVGRDIQRASRTQLGYLKQISLRGESSDAQPIESTVQVHPEKNSSSQGVISEDTTCVDKSASCGYWATIGECTRNPSYMEVNCCVWCNHMETLKNTASNSCTDKNANCSAWADIGECCKNPAYMLQSCCASCKAFGYTVP